MAVDTPVNRSNAPIQFPGRRTTRTAPTPERQTIRNNGMSENRASNGRPLTRKTTSMATMKTTAQTLTSTPATARGGVRGAALVVMVLVTTCLCLGDPSPARWIAGVTKTLRRARDTCLMRALIFDLDGTLVDTVYAHVFAWQRALLEGGHPVDGWRIHRRIGM